MAPRAGPPRRRPSDIASSAATRQLLGLRPAERSHGASSPGRSSASSRSAARVASSGVDAPARLGTIASAASSTSSVAQSGRSMRYVWCATVIDLAQVGLASQVRASETSLRRLAVHEAGGPSGHTASASSSAAPAAPGRAGGRPARASPAAGSARGGRPRPRRPRASARRPGRCAVGRPSPRRSVRSCLGGCPPDPAAWPSCTVPQSGDPRWIAAPPGRVAVQVRVPRSSPLEELDGVLHADHAEVAAAAREMPSCTA